MQEAVDGAAVVFGQRYVSGFGRGVGLLRGGRRGDGEDPGREQGAEEEKGSTHGVDGESGDPECYPAAPSGLKPAGWTRAPGLQAVIPATAPLQRQIVAPPDTSITAPLMYDASLEASHA